MGSSNSTTGGQEPHRLEPEDVFAVRTTLLQFVPMELANLILDEAKYWPKATWDYQSEDSELAVSNNATICCLLTPKLSDLISRGAARVKVVCFKILSHDQGWCNRNSFSRQYEGSWTWFEAAIIRDSCMSTQCQGMPNSKLRELVTQVVCKLRDGDTEDPNSELMIVKSPNDENSHTWTIQRNKRASEEYQLYTVIWTEELEEEAADESILMAETGRGLGRGFVKSLNMDDRIAVMARAQYPAWVNYIKRVELEIYYSV